MGRVKNALRTGRYSKYAFDDRVVVRQTKTVPKSSALAVATNANRKVNKIAKGIEYKYLDCINYTGLGTPQAISWSGIIPQYINNTTIGTSDYSNREGDKICMSYMEARFKVSYTGLMTAAQANKLVRVMIIWDYADTISSVSDLVESTAIAGADAINSPIPHDKRSKFRVLYDKTVTATYDQKEKFFKMSKKLPNIVTQYFGGGNNAIKGVLKFFAISDEATPASNAGPYLNYWIRVHYTDN